MRGPSNRKSLASSKGTRELIPSSEIVLMVARTVRVGGYTSENAWTEEKILGVLLEEGQLTQGELVARVGAARTTMLPYLERLIALGIVETGGKIGHANVITGENARGRPSVTYRVKEALKAGLLAGFSVELAECYEAISDKVMSKYQQG